MRKALSVLLALSMLLSLCVVPSFAEEAIDETVLVEEETSADGEAVDDEVILLTEGEAAEEGGEVTGEEEDPVYEYYDSSYIESIEVGDDYDGIYPAENLIDGKTSTIWQTKNMHPGNDYTEECVAAKTVTVMFTEEIAVGGVSFTTRGDLGGSPKKVAITGIYEGGAEKLLYMGNIGVISDAYLANTCYPLSFPEGVDNNVIGMKVAVLGVSGGNGNDYNPGIGFVAFSELGFFSPNDTYSNADANFKADEVPVLKEYITATLERQGERADTTAVPNSTHISNMLDYNLATHLEWSKAADTTVENGTATIELTSSIPFSISGIRVYNRNVALSNVTVTGTGITGVCSDSQTRSFAEGQYLEKDGTYYVSYNPTAGGGNQRVVKGYVMVSDGKSWEKADLVTTAQKDMLHDFYFVKDGVPYDIKGKYITLVITEGNPVSIASLRFLAPGGNTLIDMAAYGEAKTDEDVLAVKEAIEALAGSETWEDYVEKADAVAEARAAYGKLSDSEKFFLSYGTEGVNYSSDLEKAEDFVAASLVISKIDPLQSFYRKDKDAVAEARAAYDELTDAQKEIIQSGFETDYLAILTGAETDTALKFIYEEGDFALPSGVSLTGDIVKADGSHASISNISNIKDGRLTTNSEAIYGAGGKAYLTIDLGQSMTFSGLRVYARRGTTAETQFGSWTTSNFQSMAMGNIYVSETGNDGDWVPADTVGAVSHVLKLTMDVPTTFGGVDKDVTARYIKLQVDSCAGSNVWTASEIRLLKPIGKDEAVTPSEIPAVTGNRTFSIDITNKAETNTAEVTLSNGAEVETITTNEVALKEEDYTLSENTITFKDSYINALPVGTTIVYVELATGEIYKVTFNITDESQVLYCYADVDGPGTSDVVLKNVDGIEEGDITVTVRTSEEDAGVNVSATVTNESITITRINFRKSGSYYGLLGIEEDAKKVLYVDVPNGERTTTYKVVIYADWQEITSNGKEANFEDDEIPVVSGWKVRADSTRNSNSKLVTAFTDGAKETTLGGEIWHSWHNNVGDPDVVPGNGTRYFDIDLGEEAPTVGGLRYYPTSRGSDWGTVVIEGWDGDEWVEVYNSGQNVANLEVDGKVDMKFSSNTTYRYYRASLNKITHARAYKVRLLCPMDKILGTYSFETGFPELEENLVVNYQTWSEEKYVTKVEIVDEKNEVTEVENISETYGEVEISKDYIADLAVGTYTIKVYIDGSETPLETTLEITDNSKGEFKFVYVGTTPNLSLTDSITLNNVLGGTVNKITLESDETVEIPFTDTKETITIGRSDFRKAFDVYKYLGIEEGTVKIKVTFENEESLVYTIKLSGDWLEKSDLSQEVAFADFSTPNDLDITDEVIDITEYNDFKVRTDSSQSATSTRKWHVANAFFKQPANGSGHGQNFHTALDEGKVHYIDVDFGDVVPVGGIRYIARKNGTTKAYMIDWGTVTISGATEFGEWGEPLYQGTGVDYNDATGETPVKCGYDYKFTKTAEVRYLRIYFDDASYHTADAIRILEPRLGVETASLDIFKDAAESEDRTFEFYNMPEGNPTVTITVNETEVQEADYTLDPENETITFNANASFLEGLSAGSYEIAFNIGDSEVKSTLNVKDRYIKDYLLAGDDGSESTIVGDGDLVLSVNPDLIGKIAAVKSGSVEFTEYTLDEEASTLTIARAKFRRNLDLYRDGAVIEITFTDETPAKNYVVKTTAVWNELGTVTETMTHASESWKDDEIVAKSTWKVRSDAAHSTNWAAANAFSRKDANTYVPDDETDEDIFPQTGITSWHSNIGDGGKVRHYFDVDFGEDTTFAGIRYYARSNNNSTAGTWDISGTWNAVNIYGSTDGITWTLIKYADIDEAAINAATSLGGRQATVLFDKEETYRYARIVVENNGHATARYISFLNESAIQVEVSIDASGGTVTIGEPLSKGGEVANAATQTVKKDTAVTYVANSIENSTFKYWIEVNTGKIIPATTDGAITISGAVDTNLRAIFDNGVDGQRFVTFFGKDGKIILGSGYVDDGRTPADPDDTHISIVPTELKAYISGYTFEGYKAADGETILNPAENTEATDYYAYYKEKEITKVLTVNEYVEVSAEGAVVGDNNTWTVPYGTRVILKAADAEGKFFSHWEADGKAVSYDKTFSFAMPNNDTTVVPVYAEEKVEAKINVSLTVNAQETDNGDGTSFAGFVITRYVPKGYTVVESGIVYVRDAAYADASATGGIIDVNSVGKEAANGKKVAVSVSDAKATGQYKFNGRYQHETGMTAIAFITYQNADGTYTTIYSDVVRVPVIG